MKAVMSFKFTIIMFKAERTLCDPRISFLKLNLSYDILQLNQFSLNRIRIVF